MVAGSIRLVAAAALAAGIGVPVLLSGVGTDGASTFEPTTIRRYVADFDVEADGDLQVTETLTVNFPSSDRHGIFRFWDVADPNHPGTRLVPEDISVTRDGAEEDVEMSREDGGRFRVARIGSPSVFVPSGDHVYVLDFAIDGVLTPGQGDQPTQFYWNLIPGGWRQRIDQAELTVHLPAPAEGVQCTVGVGQGTPCTVTGEGTDTLTVRAAGLAPNTPVTIQAGLDLPTPDPGRSVPWSIRFDAGLGSSVLVLVGAVAWAAAAGGLGLLLSRRTRETAPAFPLQYAPPPCIGPAQAAYLLTEQVKREAYVASLLHAAERGAVRLDHHGQGWTVTRLQPPPGQGGVDPVTGALTASLTGPTGQFTADPDSVTAGKALTADIARFTSSVTDWAKQTGLMISSGVGCIGVVPLLLALGLAGLIIFTDPFGARVLALIPGLFLIGGAEVMEPGARTLRTPAGRDLWMRIGGFQRILSTPSSLQRFEFAGRQQLYAAYLPWAVAFGCADNWADKYRTEMGSEPPTPLYVGGYGYGANSLFNANQMVGDFSSAVDSAISSYAATQRSSSGGGGGFSGGGGGGGGGGGSW